MRHGLEDMHFLEESDKLMIAKPEIYTQNGNHVFSAHLRSTSELEQSH